MKKHSVIYINWNSGRYTCESIKSLIETHKNILEKIEILVVDNNSATKDVQIIKNFVRNINEKNEDSLMTLVENENNIGFSKACNQAAELTESEFIVFVNPDTVFSEDTIAILENEAGNMPKTGLIAPMIISNDKPFYSPGKDLNIMRIALGEVFLNTADRVGLNSYGAYYLNLDENIKADWVIGAYLMLRRSVFEKVGGFDERFFLYAEEQDLCRKIRKIGYNIIYCPKTSIVHFSEGSAKSVPKLTTQRKMESEYKYMKKWNGVVYAKINCLVNGILCFVKGLFIWRRPRKNFLMGKERLKLLFHKE